VVREFGNFTGSLAALGRAGTVVPRIAARVAAVFFAVFPGRSFPVPVVFCAVAVGRTLLELRDVRGAFDFVAEGRVRRELRSRGGDIERVVILG
jgi:hypothetical protein